jgi:orotate phosphoribosyltransferase
MGRRIMSWNVEEIQMVQARFFDHQIDHDDFREIGRVLEAFWEHKGDPVSAKYHAIMVSGLHTNGFVNCSTYMAETNLAEILAKQLILNCKLKGEGIDVVVGPALAAITLTFEVARQLRARHGFTEKDPTTGHTTKIGGRMRIRPGERVLILNELMSTPDGSTLQTLEGVRKHQPQAVILPFVATLVNRSGVHQLADGTTVRSEFQFSMPTWRAEECIYCSAGSIPIKPKITQENWDKLTGKIA